MVEKWPVDQISGRGWWPPGRLPSGIGIRPGATAVRVAWQAQPGAVYSL
ncbi:hypothetical protein [Nocardia transvalensis]|nr:hypothetical protein [Nocardia transvalensis]MBF6332617.1 hypothetical protein [Nocardia transvalensis]